MIKKLFDGLKDEAVKRRDVLLAAAIFAGAGGCAALALLFGPPRLVERTESPQFCALCHASQSGDWTHSLHRRTRCIDCHLPNDNVADHYLWKSIDGGKDLFFQFSGLGDGNDTELTPHGKKVLQANCVRCHSEMVSRIDNRRNCADCHRQLGHRLTAPQLAREENTYEKR